MMATEVMDLMLGRLRGGPFRFQSEQRRCKHADKISAMSRSMRSVAR